MTLRTDTHRAVWTDSSAYRPDLYDALRDDLRVSQLKLQVHPPLSHWVVMVGVGGFIGFLLAVGGF